MQAAWRLNCRPPRGWFSFERAWRLNSYRGSPEDLFEAPAFVFTRRTALDDSDHIALMRLAVLIVRHEIRALGDNPFVDRMRYPPAHFDHDGLLHLRAGHDADFFRPVPGLFSFFS